MGEGKELFRQFPRLVPVPFVDQFANLINQVPDGSYESVGAAMRFAYHSACQLGDLDKVFAVEVHQIRASDRLGVAALWHLHLRDSGRHSACTQESEHSTLGL